MWYSALQKICSPLRTRDLSVSSLNTVAEPLRKRGFFPYQFILILTPSKRAFCAYTFRSRTAQIQIYFSRSKPYYFRHVGIGINHRSKQFETQDELEAALAAYLKLPNFTPTKRPVVDWPPHVTHDFGFEPLPPNIAEPKKRGRKKTT